MVSYFVRYRGTSSDPEAFRSYYEIHHAAILRRLPNIRSLVLHHPIAWSDPLPVRNGNSFLLAQMQFDNAGDLDAALRSQMRQLARVDSGRFPPFDGEVTHEAMAARAIF
jgi:uncharacterized protein (TIGR02118 family)